MKMTLLIALFILPVLMVRAQQPPAQKPKDPNGGVVISLSVAMPMDTGKKGLEDLNKIYTSVQQAPTFPGGPEKFFDYIIKNVRYPDDARKNNVQGRVFLSFVVEKDGSIADIKVARSPSDDLSAEGIRLMKACPKWRPGFQNGRPVRVAYMVPIDFKL